MSKLQQCAGHLLEAFNHAGQGEQLLHLDLLLDLLRQVFDLIVDNNNDGDDCDKKNNDDVDILPC